MVLSQKREQVYPGALIYDTLTRKFIIVIKKLPSSYSWWSTFCSVQRSPGTRAGGLNAITFTDDLARGGYIDCSDNDAAEKIARATTTEQKH